MKRTIILSCITAIALAPFNSHAMLAKRLGAQAIKNSTPMLTMIAKRYQNNSKRGKYREHEDAVMGCIYSPEILRFAVENKPQVTQLLEEKLQKQCQPIHCSKYLLMLGTSEHITKELTPDNNAIKKLVKQWPLVMSHFLYSLKQANSEAKKVK